MRPLLPVRLRQRRLLQRTHEQRDGLLVPRRHVRVRPEARLRLQRGQELPGRAADFLPRSPVGPGRFRYEPDVGRRHRGHRPHPGAALHHSGGLVLPQKN